MLIQHHWQDNHKIRKLTLLTKRTDAPLHLQRLWSYCEIQKSEYIEKNALDLAVICFWDGDPEEWMASLQECKLIRVEGENDDGETCFRVHQWEYHNRGLLKLSEAGKKGAAERERRRKLKEAEPKAKHDAGAESRVEARLKAKPEAKPGSPEARPERLDETRVEEMSGEKRRLETYTPLTPSRGSSGVDVKSLFPEICRLYGRNDSVEWSKTELELLSKVAGRATVVEEMALLTRLKKEPAERVLGRRCQLRHRLEVGLKFWNAECDKARRYFELAEEQDSGQGGPVTFGA